MKDKLLIGTLYIKKRQAYACLFLWKNRRKKDEKVLFMIY